MAVESQEINLKNFLEKFTYIEDPEPGSKFKLPMINFLQIASLLKIAVNLEKARMK